MISNFFKEMFDVLLQFDSSPFYARKSGGDVIPIAPQLTSSQIGRGRILVEKSSEPYWKERGWIQDGNNYVGLYRTRFCDCEGGIAVSPAGYCTIHIKNPPPAVRRHPKWVCFHHKKGEWYRVHTVSECRDLSSAIFEIESIITESYESYLYAL
jgi:hypothetical protein